MIIVIQCAATKSPGAGRMRSPSGKPVCFVANPQGAPSDSSFDYARPDDASDSGMSWRQDLEKYNREPGSNPWGLFPVYQLYKHKIYGKLVDRFGPKKVFILSAGWGLIRSDYLVPCYDITFSSQADPHKRRRRHDDFKDFCMLPQDTEEEIVYFGGQDYLELFGKLTSRWTGHKTVFFNSKCPPILPGCTLERFETSAKTNWHYPCASDFLKRNGGAASAWMELTLA